MGYAFKRIVFFLGVILLNAACTQQPASIVDKSGEYYGRESSASSPEYRGPNARDFTLERDSEPPHHASPAPSPSVGVSDLPPPQATNDNHPSPAIKSTIPVGDTKFIWPVTGGKVISHFGTKPDGKSNDGINIAVPEGEPVYAVADGMVVYAGNQLPSYGNMVIIRHDNGLMTAYAHARSITVKKNDSVKQGQIIEYVGMSGSVKSPQLHFAVRNGKTPVDPERYLPGT